MPRHKLYLALEGEGVVEIMRQGVTDVLLH